MIAFAMILHCPSLMKPSLDFSQWFLGKKPNRVQKLSEGL